MGGKRPTVWTSAISGVRRYTPASSAWSKPTSTLGSCCRANFPSTVSSAAGLSLEAQPAAFTDSVSRNGLLSDMELLYRVVGFTSFEREDDLPRRHGVTEKSKDRSDESRRFLPCLTTSPSHP